MMNSLKMTDEDIDSLDFEDDADFEELNYEDEDFDV